MLGLVAIAFFVLVAVAILLLLTFVDEPASVSTTAVFMLVLGSALIGAS